MATPVLRPLVVIRFRSGVALPDTEELGQLFSDQWASSDLLERFPDLRIRRLFRAATPAQLKRLENDAHDLDPHYPEEGRLFLYYQAEVAANTDLVALERELKAQLPIEYVRIQTRLTPLAASEGGYKNIKHLEPAPKGIGVDAVAGLSGGYGEDQVIADVEDGWDDTHDDFKVFGSIPPIAFTRVPGSVNPGSQVDHGTAVIGIVAARQNTKYALGVAPRLSTIFLSSIERTDSGPLMARSGDPPIPPAANAIMAAILPLTAGDIILIEVCGPNPLDSVAVIGGSAASVALGPLEGVVPDEDILHVIQLATSLHITVIEPAGKGITTPPGDYVDLDLPSPFVHDSGAIMVGASDYDLVAAAHNPKVGHCRSNRINCFAWGTDILTTWVNAGASDVTAFGGTSAASAIVAGVAAVVQSLMKKNHGRYLTPMQMRALLSDPDLNTHSAHSTDRIGVMPNLQAIATQLGLLPDLYIRDDVGDTGAPHALSMQSPDIIVCVPSLGGSPDAAFGEGSGKENAVGLGDSPVAGSAAEVFVRVRNRGGANATGAKVTAYWAVSSTVLTPGSWTKIKDATVEDVTVDVPAGNTIVVAGPIPWPSVPDVGHLCLIATVEHVKDATFKPASLADWNEFKSYMRRENNLAYRNYDIVSLPAAGSVEVMETSVVGPEEGGPEEMELRVDARLPEGAVLEVEIPEVLARELSPAKGTFPPNKTRDSRRGPVLRSGSTLLGRVKLGRKRHWLRLHVEIPEKERKRSYAVALVQLHRGMEVGRVTWSLRPVKES